MKNSHSSYRFIATLLLLITLGIGNMWGWATNVYLNGNFTGNNWDKATYQFTWWYNSTDGKYYMPVYATGEDQYFRLWTNNHCGPATDNSEIDAGGSGEAVSSYDAHNWKYIGNAGIINICIDQTDSKDYYPWVWIERPTIKFKYGWNGAESWSEVDATDNHDGTYQYIGQYGSAEGFNAGPSGDLKYKEASTTIIGEPTSGDYCLFVWDASGYEYGTGEDKNTGTFTITKTYTITYHTDGSTSGSAPTDATYYPHGSNAPVLDNTGLLQAGHDSIFAGWATTAERATAGTVDYDPAAGDEITSISANMNLYPVWKTGYYFISLAGSAANGTKNTTDFFTPKNLINKTIRAVNGIVFSKSVFQLSKTPTAGDNPQTFEGINMGDGKYFFAYDTKTTQTDISIYVYNDDASNAIPIYYRVLKEGDIQGVVQVDIPANSGKVVNIPTITHTKGTRVLFGAGTKNGSDYDKINFAQVRAIETGTAVPQAGQAGFELAVPGRFTASKDAASSIDGLTCIPNDNVHIISGDKNTIPLTGAQDVAATQYISFITSGPVQLQVTPKNAQDLVTFYVKKDSRTFTSSDTPYCKRSTTTSVNLPEAGTWYILSKDIIIKKIAFVAAPVITYNANGGTGTTASSTCSVAANEFTRENYTFNGWNTAEYGNGTPYAVGAETLTDLTLYAQWIANPSIVYHTDGSSSGTAPATARVPYGGDGTAADNTGLLQHANDTVFAGWATSAGSTTIEYLPGAAIETVTADVNLYPVWKKGYYFISLSGSGATGTRNDADFLTGQSLSSKNPAYAVNEVAFSQSYFKFGGTPNNIEDPQNFSGNTVNSRFVAYDTKTDNTDIYVYLYNKDAAAKTFYYRVLKEGAIEDVQEVSVDASAKVVVAIPTIEHTKGTRVLFGVSDKDNLFVTQIKALETGTALPQAGEAGYELTVPGRPTCETTGKSGRIDGLEYVAKENVKLISGSDYIRIEGTSGTECSQYIKFTAAEPLQLQVTPRTDADGNYTYYVKDSKTFTTGTDTQYGQNRTMTKVNIHETGDYYILSTSLRATKIAFAAAPEVTYNANGGTGEMAATQFTVAANTFSKEDYEFAGWNTAPNGSGMSYNAGDEVLDDVTLYAQWSIKTYTVTYHTDGASSGTAPVDGSSPYDIHSNVTVKDNTGLMQHATKVFAGWATSASSTTIEYLPNATIENIAANVDLYPVWKDGAYFISLTGSSTDGVMNTSDFLTSKGINNKPAQTVNGVTFSRSYWKFGGTPNEGAVTQNFEGITLSPRFIAYDTKTTQTDIYVYVKNDTTVSVPFYYRVLKDGAMQAMQTLSIPASAAQVVVIPTISHTRNTRVLFGAGTGGGSDYDDLYITQIKTVESGTALPQAGEDGYVLTLPGRAIGDGKSGSINGLEFATTANVRINTDFFQLTGGSAGEACSQYVKITTTEPMQLRVTPKTGETQVTFRVKRATTTYTAEDPEYGTRNTTTSVNLWEAGEWYILPSTEVRISKIETMNLSTITYNLDGGTRFFADPEYYTSDKEVTLHPAAKPGYIFGGWYDNAELSGSPITTIPAGSTDNKTFYAKWNEASCTNGDIFTYTNYGSEPGNANKILADGQYVNCAPGYATIMGGTAVYGSTGRTTSIDGKQHRLYFTHENSRLIINLDCSLQPGDSITITGTSSCVYALTATNERSTDIVTSCESEGDTMKSTYIVQAGSPLEGASTLYVWHNEATAYLLTLTIHRKEWIIEGDGTWSTKLAGVTIDDAVKLRGTITVDVDAQAKAVTLDRSGTHAGKLIVNAGKELVVAQTVRQFNGTANVPTEEENLVLGSSASGNGALVMGSHNGTNHATVYFYSKSGGAKNSNASINQFIGTPFVSHTNWVYNYYNSWLLKVDYSADKPVFALLGGSDTMDPFAGYCVIYNGDAGHTYEMTGTLVATTDKTCSDLHYVSGTGSNTNNENLLANSWTAPIRIAAFKTSDFVNTDATVYIFNSGSKDDVDNEEELTKGQYITIPIGSADDAVIPSMQSFSVYTNASGGSSVTLDYSRLVYDPAVEGTAVVGPNKAPQREETTRRMRILVQGENGFGDILSLLEREDLTTGFDNGWDGRKMYGESFAPQFYAVTPDGNMAVNSVPDWEGTVLGFKAGSEDNTYTFSFEYNEPEPLYLLDTENGTYTRVLNENTYTFATTDKNDHSRFILTRHAPQTPTEVTNVQSDKAPCTKILLDNNLYILRDGRLYNATGAMVK